MEISITADVEVAIHYIEQTQEKEISMKQKKQQEVYRGLYIFPMIIRSGTR